MIVFVGIPDQQLKILDHVPEGILVKKLDLQSISCNGLASIISASEKLYETDKRINNVINGIFTYIKTHYPSEFINLEKEFTKNTFETNMYKVVLENNLPMKSKRKLSERRITIEDYLTRTEHLFREIEKEYAEQQNEFIKSIKRNEQCKRKVGTDLKDAVLNNFCSEEKHEFLMNFYVVKNKKDNKVINIIFSNEKLFEGSLKLIAQDNSNELYTFIGLKSTEEQVKEDCKKYDFLYKSFIKEEEFKIIKDNLNDYEENKNSHFIFLRSTFVKLTELICNFRFSKAYLDCILSYGLPPDYVFYSVFSDKTKELNEFLSAFSKEADMYVNIKKYTDKMYGDLVVVNVNLPIYEEDIF
ncbi:hypothetical protein H312_02436 [Anncaliia algerae PRA339]|uniref:V-type proton ATPase subunit C n=1 Tax=Anncaliia algerae PRA339 TaxID=1288291 RepID=A0A059EYQ4_9MICR|nr:hypothetical protein H312_02436 [Anncaliia algerae PRA339]